MALCLYSTSTWIKWYICKVWRDDTHLAWCCPVFDPRLLGAEDRGSLIPPTSSPANIYKDLAAAVRNRDRHNPKIVEQKGSLTELTESWRQAGEISDDDANEILYILQDDDLTLWRPVLFIIPRLGIQPERIELVPVGERAGLGEEYRIRDLRGHEFDRVEFNGN